MTTTRSEQVRFRVSVRIEEDAALVEWLHAVREYDAAVAHRTRALARAQDRVERAMRPLSPLRYRRLEAAVAAQDRVAAAEYVADLGSLTRLAPAVAAARARLASLTATEDLRLAAVAEARADAAASLLAVHPSAEVLAVAGASRHRLAALARHRTP